ncbi:MAG TPA: DUF6798 domain-containing protein [Pirellulales bacterium]|nr:DUF6798 domain-containing protein [Pirellulales bacterium]
MPATADNTDTPPPSARWIAPLEIALLLAVFSFQAGWPAPDVNEPHYLGKARHFWDPAWAAGDFFFESSDTHRVFYLTCGWPSHWLSLPHFAWCGRLVSWLLLAVSWQRLCRAVVGRPGWAVPAGALFLALNVGCHLAGEWVVGGFEAKGLAYALVFAGLAAVIRDRWNTAFLLFGAASALHVLVGGWSALAAAFCWLVSADAPPLARLWPGLLGGALLALLGIVPALELNWGVDTQLVAEANDIYVFRRLPHHLVPESLRWPFLLRFLLMVLVWLALTVRRNDHRPLRKLESFVVAALAISFAGMLLSQLTANVPETKAAILRYYWFRLADVMVPVGIALAAVTGWSATSRARRGAKFAWQAAGWLAVCAALVAYGQVDYAGCGGFQNVPRADKKVLDHADWRDVCQWMGDHTPSGALAITPRMAQTFTWYAGRGQVVSWKDLPQDAEAVVRWWQRLEDIHGMPHPEYQGRWHESLTELSPRRLRELGRRYRADYLVVEAEPPLELPRLYANGSYCVYKLD